MQRNIGIKLAILFIVITLAIAGWVVGIQTLKKSNSNTNNTTKSKDVLVYSLREPEKITFYKTHLEKNDAQPFYALTGSDAKNFNGASVIKNTVTTQLINDLEERQFDYLNLSLAGIRSSVSAPISVRNPNESPFNMPTDNVQSTDGKWTTKVEVKTPEEVLSPHENLIISSDSKVLKFSMSNLPHKGNFRAIWPERFSPDNTSLFVTLLQWTGDPGAAFGLYQIDLASQEIKEIVYDANPEGIAPVFVYLQPSTQYAYHRHGKTMTQINIRTLETKTVLSNLDSLNTIVFGLDEKTIILPSAFDEEKPVRIVDIETGMETLTPSILGTFQALSSDKKFLVYSKYSEEFREKPFTNTSSFNAIDRKILVTEYHVLDIENKKDIKLFTNKMVLSDSGSYVGLDGKEYSFIGLVTAN